MKNVKIIINRQADYNELRYNYETGKATIIARNAIAAIKGLIELKKKGVNR